MYTIPIDLVKIDSINNFSVVKFWHVIIQPRMNADLLLSYKDRGQKVEGEE